MPRILASGDMFAMLEMTGCIGDQKVGHCCTSPGMETLVSSSGLMGSPS